MLLDCRSGLSSTGAGMEYTTLGRTGLRVSVAGLGCGGFSRLGLGTGKDEARRDRHHPCGARSRGQSVRHRRRLRHRAGARQGAARRAARRGRDLHQGAVRHQQPRMRRRRRAVASLDRSLQGTRHRLYRRLPAARRRRRAPTTTPREAHRAGAAAREGEGQIPPSRHHRDRAGRSRRTRWCSAPAATGCGMSR